MVHVRKCLAFFGPLFRVKAYGLRLIKVALLFSSYFFVCPVFGAEPFKATPDSLKAEDLADALGVHHWNFRVNFDPPVKSELRLTLFEFKAQRGRGLAENKAGRRGQLFEGPSAPR